MTIRQKLAQWFYSPGAYGLWVALEDPTSWKIESHLAFFRPKVTLRHSVIEETNGDVVMWIANGGFFFNGHPDRGTPKFLGVFERHLLWRKFKTLNNRKVLYLFTRLEDPK